MKETIVMTTKELERISVLDNLLARKIKQKHAAASLSISVRQVRRIVGRYKQESKQGLTHLARGKQSNRAIGGPETERVLDIVRRCYSDFGPTLALEKLIENHGVTFGVDTLRKAMIKADLWMPKRRKEIIIHTYRERRSCLGELVQLDGSPHRWFEDRADPCTLVAFIDDATSRILSGEFVEYEGTFPLFGATEHYLRRQGKPLAFYLDKHSTYKVNKQASVEEELRDGVARSQFGRAMIDLNIELIFANSPQAKGRVERLFETLQDRLVKEMRLAGINSREEGTKYFREVYIPKHNARFAVAPREITNLHRPLLHTDDLTRIFTLQSKRLVTQNLMIQYKNSKYQLTPENSGGYSLRGAAVAVEEGRDGVITIRYKNRVIPHTVVLKQIHQETKIQLASTKEFKERRIYIPSADHPWRQYAYVQQ